MQRKNGANTPDNAHKINRTFGQASRHIDRQTDRQTSDEQTDKRRQTSDKQHTDV